MASEQDTTGAGDNNNHISDRGKSGAEHEKAKIDGDQHPKPDNSTTTAPITALDPSIALTTAGGSGERKKPGPGLAGGYRADAGGSLRIPRQRVKKSKTSRGSVRDLFKDQDQAKQE